MEGGEDVREFYIDFTFVLKFMFYVFRLFYYIIDLAFLKWCQNTRG